MALGTLLLPTLSLAAEGVSRGAAAQTTVASGGDTLLLVEKVASKLVFLDPDTGDRRAEVALPQFPHEFVVDRANRHAFVAHYGLESSDKVGEGGTDVVVVDLLERRVVHSLECAPFNRLHGIGLDEKGRLTVLSEEKGVLVSFDDPVGAKQPSAAANTGGIKTHLFSLSRDGERAWVTGLLSNTVSLIRPRDASVAPVVTRVGTFPEGNCLSPDEKTLYVGNRRSGSVTMLDADTLKVRATREVGGDPVRLYAMADGRLLLLNLAGESASLLKPDMSNIWTMKLGAKPAGASLHPTAARAFISLASDEVLTVDLETQRVERRFKTGAGADVTRWLPAAG
ncbi:YncE family protein [Roseomonas elaeocarpi]|uniref:YncE family protein n=1 Tax=Roseomonas elaeocarpi TaxID=907779 RepID=A0ABV6JUE2_9PROT